MKVTIRRINRLLLLSAFSLLLQMTRVQATDYYIHPVLGDDQHTGTSRDQAFRTLERMAAVALKPGDRILLAAGMEIRGSLQLSGVSGTAEAPVRIGSIAWDGGPATPAALINFQGHANGILIEDGSYITVDNIQLSGNGHGMSQEESPLRCAVMIRCLNSNKMSNIQLTNLVIRDVYYENPGFLRDKREVQTANGTQRYGWGIRVINEREDHLVENIEITNCSIRDVSHTGIKLTGSGYNIRQVGISNNNISYTGGPGIQMSGVKLVHVYDNVVDHSGSNNDSRKWGRGSGLWTWSSSQVLIEHNQFRHANGPGDSAGAHIDFNCDNVVIQYNLSLANAGGFCEILGNTSHCAYRYNISVNDGYREKGKNGAFQEGKIIWLSGYVGNKRPRIGPVSCYIYNNSIYCDSGIVPRIAIDHRSTGVLIANNIFYLQRPVQWVNGDQERPDSGAARMDSRVRLLHNLYLHKNSLPDQGPLRDEDPLYGDPGFTLRMDSLVEGFIPRNTGLVRHRGISLDPVPGDSSGLMQGIGLNKDVLGHQLTGLPPLGAIQPLD